MYIFFYLLHHLLFFAFYFLSFLIFWKGSKHLSKMNYGERAFFSYGIKSAIKLLIFVYSFFFLCFFFEQAFIDFIKFSVNRKYVNEKLKNSQCQIFKYKPSINFLRWGSLENIFLILGINFSLNKIPCAYFSCLFFDMIHNIY